MTSILILENLRSVENTASIFRTADRFRISKTILVGTTPAPVDRFGRKRLDFAKVSLGAEDRVDWEYVRTQDLGFKIEDLREQGFKIIALEQTPEATNIRNLPKPNKFALIVGNEVTGISKEALNISDVVTEISMEGTGGSLNVSVATGVALFVLS